jgi:hypothetical protein
MLIRSGVSILMDHPRLYWNDHCTPGNEWIRFTPLTSTGGPNLDRQGRCALRLDPGYGHRLPAHNRSSPKSWWAKARGEERPGRVFRFAAQYLRELPIPIIAPGSDDIHHRTRDDPLIVDCRSLCDIEDKSMFRDVITRKETYRRM